jgi:hypothetical protein
MKGYLQVYTGNGKGKTTPARVVFLPHTLSLPSLRFDAWPSGPNKGKNPIKGSRGVAP